MKRRVRSGIIAAALVLALAAAWVRFGPFDDSLLDPARFESLTLLDRNGEVLYEPLAATGSRAMWMKSDAIPELVVDATLAAEDGRFFHHPGIDPIAVARAAWHDVRALRFVEGGSTISQQVVKMLAGSPKRTLFEKGGEAVLAMRLEHRLSKREILALYLNLAPYGNRINGIARASRAYFGVEPAQLTAAQAAFLASLPQRPTAFNPLRDPTRARARQKAVLARMKLRDDVRMRAMREELRFVRSERAIPAMHFVERVLALQPAGAKTIRTTIDLGLQREIAGIVSAQRENLLRHGATSVAVAVLDNARGEWLAWEGSGDYFGTRFGGAIDGVTTPRQPGSTLKPFTYALAFESGESPATVLADVEAHFPTAEPGVVYTPRNYDGRYRGPLLAREALAGSENVPAVALLSRVGPESLLRLLRKAGFDTLDRTADYYGLGLTLGDAEVTLEQLVTAYAALARGGESVHPKMLIDEKRRSAGGRLVSARTAFWISDILSDPEAREFAFGRGGSLDFPFPVAVKTGTSQAYRDNWTIGYTKEVTVGVWVGNFDRRELHGSSGITGAAPVFNAVMLAAMKRARGALPVGETAPVLAPPDDLEEIPICTLSGARPTPSCPAVRNEWIVRDQPARFCSWHHDGWIDYPPEFQAWARTQNANTPAKMATRHEAPFRISNPANGTTFLIDPTLRSEFQTLRLRAHATSRVSWRVDSRHVGSAAADASVEWPLAAGAHTIVATDAQGRSDSVRVFVK